MKRDIRDTNAVNNGIGWIDYSDLAHAITVPMPCYKLNGDFWYEDDVPNGNTIAYHLSVTDATMAKGMPFYAVAPIQTYRETLRALLLAGF